MAKPRMSIRQQALDAKREDKKLRKAWADIGTRDSFQNFEANLGMGTNNMMASSTYGFNPITRERTLLEWIHRGSWLGGVAVDKIANDMTREGVTIKGELKPDLIDAIEEFIEAYNIWPQTNETVKWSRLYGGAVGVYLVEGQKFSTPLRIETVGRNQFKGICVMDRWMLNPSLGDLVTDFGPHLGLPKYYTVTAGSVALRGEKIHYTRLFRLDGVKLPIWQRQTENLWGVSVLERLYDRMIAFDSATTGAAQLVYKAYIRTYKIDGLRDIIAAGGDTLAGLVKYVDMMRRFQSIEGITLLDKEDEYEQMTHGAFSGLNDVLMQLAGQCAGALDMPLVHLMGESPGGLGSNGNSEMRTYYDGIKQQQKSTLGTPIVYIYRMAAQSLGIKIPKGFGIEFNSLYKLNEIEKATIAVQDTERARIAQEGGLVRQSTVQKELKQSSDITGRWTNVSQEEIAATEAAEEQDEPPKPEKILIEEMKADAQVEAAELAPAPAAPGAKAPAKKPAKANKTKDDNGPTYYPEHNEWF